LYTENDMAPYARCITRQEQSAISCILDKCICNGFGLFYFLCWFNKIMKSICLSRNTTKLYLEGHLKWTKSQEPHRLIESLKEKPHSIVYINCDITIEDLVMCKNSFVLLYYNKVSIYYSFFFSPPHPYLGT